MTPDKPSASDELKGLCLKCGPVSLYLRGKQAHCSVCHAHYVIVTPVFTLPVLDTRDDPRRAVIDKWRDAAVWEHDDMSNIQSAQTFDQCANELQVLLDAAVATRPDPPGEA